MILVYPPVAKPCEPPAGIAKLLGAIGHHGTKSEVLDANLEGLLNLLQSPNSSTDTWTLRAARNLSIHLTSLQSMDTYLYFARYKRAIMDISRLLTRAAIDRKVRLGLTNYQHLELSPARSEDLIRAAEKPEENPFYPYYKERLLPILEEAQPSVFGFSLNYLSQALCTFAMVGFIKQHWPQLPIVLGGGLVTSWMRRPSWRNRFGGLVDHFVAGPGEYPLLSLLNRRKKFTGVHFVPDYDPLPREAYLAPGFILPYSASNGCYWSQCLFCPERAEGNSYTPTPSGQVLLDLRQLVKKTNPLLIHFLDNALHPELMQRIMAHPPGVPWYGFARITRHLTDLDFCLALKKSGCVMVQLGLESGDQGVLDQLQKGVDLRMASLALKVLKKAGIATYVYLLFGTPAETLTEARKTLEFTVQHHDQILFLNLAIFNLPVHAPEAPAMETEKFYEGDLSLYLNFFHPGGWTRNLVRQFLDKEFKRHPAIAPILRRDPPFFTSNHAPLFLKNGGQSS